MKLALFTCLAVALGAVQLTDGVYAIHGLVTDSSGNRVADVSVQLLKLDGAPASSRQETVSRQDGSYELGELSAGRYRLFVSKANQGVPDMRFLIFEQVGQVYNEITVGPGAPKPQLDLKLPLPFGEIDGRVIESGKGGRAVRGRIHLERADAKQITYETDTDQDGHFTLLVPNRPISFSMTAPGYEQWVYHDDQGKALLSLAQGKKINVDVVMKKKNELPKP